MVDENEARIAELERENAELNVELGREARIAGLATVTMHEQYAKLARLQAVARAANRVSSSDGLDLTIWGCAYSANGTDMCGTKRNPGLLCGFCELKAKTEGLERDDLKGVK